MSVPWIVRKLRNVAQRVLIACGVDFYHRSEDRRVLETTILPFFARQAETRRVLFVGCAWYTRGYRKIFRDQEYTTLEIDPRAARYGARRHIVDALENVRRHFQAGELDLIVCNGVFGWGLDEKAAVERAFGGCWECLREGGIFLLGWNDVPRHRPFALEECGALCGFEPYVFPPLSVSAYRTDTYNRHTYHFYRR